MKNRIKLSFIAACAGLIISHSHLALANTRHTGESGNPAQLGREHISWAFPSPPSHTKRPALAIPALSSD